MELIILKKEIDAVSERAKEAASTLMSRPTRGGSTK